MKVIAIFDFITSPLSECTGDIKIGQLYTVTGEQSGWSSFANRMVDAYSLEGIDGLFEQGIFMPLSDIEESALKVNENHRL